jgi:hypothetical protein
MILSNAIIDKISSQKDGSLKISLLTRELNPSQLAEIFINVNKEIMSIDIPEPKMEEDEKSPATRLRNVFYRIYEQKDLKEKMTFEFYYRQEMEKLIDYLKEKLN